MSPSPGQGTASFWRPWRHLPVLEGSRLFHHQRAEHGPCLWPLWRHLGQCHRGMLISGLVFSSAAISIGSFMRQTLLQEPELLACPARSQDSSSRDCPACHPCATATASTTKRLLVGDTGQWSPSPLGLGSPVAVKLSQSPLCSVFSQVN